MKIGLAYFEGNPIVNNWYVTQTNTNYYNRFSHSFGFLNLENVHVFTYENFHTHLKIISVSRLSLKCLQGFIKNPTLKRVCVKQIFVAWGLPEMKKKCVKFLLLC